VASNFPTSLDNFTNPSSGNTLDSPSHSLQHSDINDAVEAMQRKVGVGTAVAGSASAGQVLTISAAGTSTWSDLPASGGLIQVVPTSVAVGSGSGSVNSGGAVTFSGASSISINSCFTSTYDAYKIVFSSIVGSANALLRLRWRKSGTDNTGATYYSAVHFTNWSGVAGVSTSSAAATSSAILSLPTTQGSLSLEVYSPLSRPKVTGLGVAAGPEDRGVYISAYMNNTDTYDGITFFPASGTIDGTVRIYGYKNG
jgi:hypothetical protein